MRRQLFCGMLILDALTFCAHTQAQTIKSVCSMGCDYASNNLQQAVDDAVADGGNWVLVLTAGQTFTPKANPQHMNEAVLTLRAGLADWAHGIIIRSSGLPNLPSDTRVGPASSANMALLEPGYPDSNAPAIVNEKGAAFYRFEGVEIAPIPGAVPLYNLVQLGTVNDYGVDDHERADLAHDIVFDRTYIHGWDSDTNGPYRCVMANMGNLTITNSWIGNCRNADSEGQAVAGWNATGPYYFRNNHFESSAITTIFGGAVPNIPGVRLQGAAFLGNHYYRPWIWRKTTGPADPAGTCLYDSRGGEFYQNTQAGTYWNCVSGTWAQIQQGAFCPTGCFMDKNQFELKNASQVLVEGNLIENAYQPAFGGQHGAAFLFNQVDNDPDHGAFGEPAAVISWVLVRNNLIKNTPWAVSMGGTVLGRYFANLHDIVFDNNLFTNMGAEPQSLGDSRFTQTGIADHVRYSHNTAIFDHAKGDIQVDMFPGTNLANPSHPSTDFMNFSDNILSYNARGFYAETGEGNLFAALWATWALNRSFAKNVVVDDQGTGNVVTNLMTAAPKPPYDGVVPCPTCAVPRYWENGGTNDVGFVNFTGGDYHLKGSSRYKNWAFLAKDPGADVDVVNWSTAHAADGAPNPYLDFAVKTLTPGQTTANLSFTAYDTSACTLTVSSQYDYATTVFALTDTGGDPDRQVTITGLTPDSRYYYRIICAGPYRREGSFFTLPSPQTFGRRRPPAK